MRLLKTILCFTLSAMLVSCVHQRSFVATSFEPFSLEKKGDFEGFVSVRPFKYYSAGFTAAITDNIALRASYGGFRRLDNYSASLIVYKKYERVNLFIAPTFNYQNNYSKGEIGRFLINNHKVYDYDCRYYSPSLAIGLTLQPPGSSVSQQFVIKAQYNIVDHYSYYFYMDNGSGSSYSFEILNNERLHKRIPGFISVEPTYMFLVPAGKCIMFKFQAGANIVQRSFKHEYKWMKNDAAGKQQVDAVSLHPSSLGINLGLGIIFRSIRHDQKRKTANSGS